MGDLTVLTIAGTGSSGTADDVTGTSAGFNRPFGTAFAAGTTLLYVCDRFNNRIRTMGTTGTYPVAVWVGPTGGKTGFAGGSFDLTLTHSLSMLGVRRIHRQPDPNVRPADRPGLRLTGLGHVHIVDILLF